MKKLSIVAVICIIAMLFASCSGNPESKPYAPDWAEGNYTGSVTVPVIGESTAEAEITSSSFSITVNVRGADIPISSSDEGVSTVKNEYTDTSWTIELSVISVAGDNNIPVTITKGENGELNVTVDYLGGISGVLTPVTEETPAV